MTQEQALHASEEATPGNLVTESLLSWAKDVRYVTEIQEALHRALEPHTSSLGIKTHTWYMSYLLYVLTVMRRKGQSLGMEATGLKFLPTRSRPILVLAVWGVGTWLLHGFWSERNRQPPLEELRGSDRQNQHELLRQQMFERSAARSHPSVPLQSSRWSQSNANRRASAKDHHDRILSVLNGCFRAIFRSVFEAVRCGPHNVMSSNEGFHAAPLSILTWVFRLYTAQYLTTGKHPTIVHRLLGLQHERQTKSRGLSVDPGGHRMVAFLIALQGSTTLVRASLKMLTSAMALHLEKQKAANNEDGDSSEIPSGESLALSLCTICRTPRERPVASRTCGHVFCWSCLSHWVSSVKEACPYCRALCRKEDIQPLYNYDKPRRRENFAIEQEKGN
jgi:Ring finger domain